jgi:hypothetical protein
MYFGALVEYYFIRILSFILILFIPYIVTSLLIQTANEYAFDTYGLISLLRVSASFTPSAGTFT